MRKRQEKNIHIQPPRNILLQFFFFSHQSQDIKRIFKYLLVTVAYEKSWFRVLEVLWTGEKGFSQVEETFSSFFFPFLVTWSDTNIYKNGNIFDFTSSKINFDRSTYNFFSPKCLQICKYSSKRYASIFPNWYKNFLSSL